MKELITTAVLNGIRFEGKVGTTYSVEDLIHNVSVRSLNSMYQRVRKELSSMDTDSLYETSNSAKRKNLEFQASLIKEIFTYKQGLAKAAKELEDKRANAASKLAALRNIKEAKELETMGKMSLEDIEKEIAAAEALAV